MVQHNLYIMLIFYKAWSLSIEFNPKLAVKTFALDIHKLEIGKHQTS